MARRMLTLGVLLDLASLVVAFGVASLIVFETPSPWSFRDDVWGMLGGMMAGAVIGLYIANRSASKGVPRPAYGRAVTMIGVSLAVSAVSLLFTRSYFSRNFMIWVTAVWAVLALGHRWARRLRPWTERLAVVTGEKTLVEDLLNAPHADVVAVFDPSGSAPEEPLPAGTTLTVDLRSVLSDDMARFVSSCNLAGYPMRSLVSVYEEHTGRLAIVHLVEGWELTVPLDDHGQYVKTKRIVDFLVVLALSPLALALGVLLGAAVKLDSRGPVIFKQERIGRDGKPFRLYKFRTMRDRSVDKAQFAARGDARLTRVGRVLRRLRVDELPQLWNVLKGDLSLVGPRPEQRPFVEEFSASIPFYDHRHLVRPGLTGWAQVNYGYADSKADTIEKLAFDLYYVKHVSPWLDLEVLGRSVWTVLSGFGAR